MICQTLKVPVVLLGFNERMSALTQAPTQPPIQCVPEALPTGVKQPWHKGHHSPPSNAKVKNEYAIPPLP
jgi:hypothetical protein